MVKTGEYGVVLFYSLSNALQAEKEVKKQGMAFKLIPVPRHLSSDCGVCLRFNLPDEPVIRAVLQKAQIDVQGVYEV